MISTTSLVWISSQKINDSVGGYIIGLLDHLPQAGEEVTSGNLRFVVDTVERNRIDKVHLYILDAPQKSEESEQESKPER